MPRRLKNFKIRQAKFLLLDHLKYQKTGTYTGSYKGPAVSDRRLQYAKNPRQRLRLPLLDTLLGSPIDKGPAIESLGAKRGNQLFLFRNTRTNQVLYSLTGNFDPEQLLPQLTFYGKKTVPSKYRKDDWRPFAAIRLESPNAALLCYWQLQELRMLRDYAWREKGSNCPPKELRKKKLMNQTGTSVCDASTAVAKIYEPITRVQHSLLVQWKAVEDLANEANYGALNVLRKQISRAQRVLTSKDKDKKFPNASSLVRLKGYMETWYKDQTMMYKAVAAVNKVRDAALAGRERAEELRKQLANGEDGSFDKSSLQDVTTQMESIAANVGLKEGEESRPFLHEEFTKKYGVRVHTPLAELTASMAKLSFMQEISEAVPETGRSWELETLSHEVEQRISNLESYRNRLQAIQAVQPGSWTSEGEQNSDRRQNLHTEIETASRILKKDRAVFNRISTFMRATNAESFSPSATVFWSSIDDRKYTNSWPEYTTHMTMGPRRGRDQYFAPNLSLIEADSHNWDGPIFAGNEKIDEGIKHIRPKNKRKNDDPMAPFRDDGVVTAEKETLRVWSDVLAEGDEIGKKEMLANEEFREIIEAERVKSHYMAYLDDITQTTKKTKKAKDVPMPAASLGVPEMTQEEARV